MFQPCDGFAWNLLVAFEDHDRVSAPFRTVQLHGGYIHGLVGQHGCDLGDMPGLIQVMDNSITTG